MGVWEHCTANLEVYKLNITYVRGVGFVTSMQLKY